METILTELEKPTIGNIVDESRFYLDIQVLDLPKDTKEDVRHYWDYISQFKKGEIKVYGIGITHYENVYHCDKTISLSEAVEIFYQKKTELEQKIQKKGIEKNYSDGKEVIIQKLGRVFGFRIRHAIKYSVPITESLVTKQKTIYKNEIFSADYYPDAEVIPLRNLSTLDVEILKKAYSSIRMRLLYPLQEFVVKYDDCLITFSRNERVGVINNNKCSCYFKKPNGWDTSVIPSKKLWKEGIKTISKDGQIKASEPIEAKEYAQIIGVSEEDFNNGKVWW